MAIRARKWAPWRVARLLAAVVLPLATAGACLYTPTRPLLLVAWGFGDGFHCFQTLEEVKGSRWRRFIQYFSGERQDRVTWDGERVYVYGSCIGCGEPSAPPGAFVAALLPRGFAHATSRSYPPNHLSRPVYVPHSRVLLLASSVVAPVSLVLGLGPWFVRWMRERWLTPPGHCPKCGYNLEGNVTGVCPECGTPGSGGSAGDEDADGPT